jgi:hypothetical protein
MRPLAGSNRDTVSSGGFATHTAASTTRTALGPFPIATAWVTRSSCGLTAISRPLLALVAQIEPRPTVTSVRG